MVLHSVLQQPSVGSKQSNGKELIMEEQKPTEGCDHRLKYCPNNLLKRSQK